MAAPVVARMALASGICWAATAWIAGPGAGAAAFFAMLGPLAAASAAWIVMERTRARAPQRMSAVMIKLFAAKLLFFGAYVAAVVLQLPAGRMAFAFGFTAQYVTLHGMEAWYLRRMLAGTDEALGR